MCARRQIGEGQSVCDKGWEREVNKGRCSRKEEVMEGLHGEGRGRLAEGCRERDDRVSQIKKEITVKEEEERRCKTKGFNRRESR